LLIRRHEKRIIAHILFVFAAAGVALAMDFGFLGDLHDAGLSLLTGSSAALAFLWIV
jgi:hypothetical protein